MAWSGLLLVAIGAVAGAPAILVVGLLLAVVGALRGAWAQRGLVAMTYERRLSTRLATWGDEITLRLTVRNRKLLPVAWLRVDDYVSEDAMIRERPLIRTDRPGLAVLRNTWTLGPYERVERTLHVVADRRGQFTFGPVRFQVADLLAAESSSEDRALPDRYLVVPRSVPMSGDASRMVELRHHAVTHGATEDPALYAGLRPYEHGDPMKRVHWRAAARTGTLRSKRYDPSRDRDAVIALDIQTVPGPHWLMAYDEDLAESLCVVALSVARDMLGAGGACGLAAPAYWGSRSTRIAIRPATGPAQLRRLAEALARVSTFASAPFESTLTDLPQWLPRPTSVVVITARDPGDYLPLLRRLTGLGFGVRTLGIGPSAAGGLGRLRRSGIEARQVQLRPDWRTCGAVELAG